MVLTGSDPILLINLDSICRNFNQIRQKAAAVSNPPHPVWPDTIPIIKSDAYGHGAEVVGISLMAAGAGAFGTGTVGEGVELRAAIAAADPGKGTKVRIIALLGAVDYDDVKSAIKYGITVFLHRPDQLEMYAAYTRQARMEGVSGKLSVALKLNSGMNRLGFDGPALLDALNKIVSSDELDTELVCTHLSSADMPEEVDFTREQARIFMDVYRKAREIKPEIAGSMCNSAGVMNLSEIVGTTQLDVPLAHRPGIALYGSSPVHGTSFEHLGAGLEPAMQMFAPVMDIHDISAGSSISYGRTFKAEKDMRIAVLRTGYADAYPRLLSSKGSVILGGKKTQVLGRVCMQMIVVEVPRTEHGHVPVAPRDWACLLGKASCDNQGNWQPVASAQDAITPESLAEQAGTISYEMFCVLGRNKKVFVESGMDAAVAAL